MGVLNKLLRGKSMQIIESNGLEKKQAQMASNYPKGVVGVSAIKGDLGLQSYRVAEALRFNPGYLDTIDTRKLYLYPCYEGDRVFQRIMCNYGNVELSNGDSACLYMAISTKEVVGKIVGYLPGGMSEFRKHLGDNKYNIRGIGPEILTLGGFSFPETMTVSQILELERLINNNGYVENRVLEPDSIVFKRFKKSHNQIYSFEENGVVKIKIAEEIFRGSIGISIIDSKLSGSTYILIYGDDGESLTINPDSDINKIYEEYYELCERVVEKRRNSKNPANKSKGNYNHKANVPVSEFVQKRKDLLEVQTIGRMFDSTNYEGWYKNERAYTTNRDVREVLEKAKKWAILMEDAMIKGYSIEESALSYLDDITCSDYISLNFGIYDSTLFRYASLLAPYWKYGEELTRYVTEVSKGNYGGSGSAVGLRRR